MRIIIAVLVLVLAFLGFLLYGIVTDEIHEASISQINTISDAQVKNISVDNPSDLRTYTHRISTYEHTSSELVTAASNYIDKMDLNYIHILYFDEDMLVHEEFSGDNISLERLHKELLIVSPHQPEVDTNLKPDDIVLFKLDDRTMMHITPSQIGMYQIAFEDYMIKFENIEKK